MSLVPWKWQSIPQEIIDTHELQVITLDYRRECQQDDIVDSLTTSEIPDDPISKLTGTNGSATSSIQGHNESQFLHMLRLSENGQEINRGRTQWRKKSSRWFSYMLLQCWWSSCFTFIVLLCFLIRSLVGFRWYLIIGVVSRLYCSFSVQILGFKPKRFLGLLVAFHKLDLFIQLYMLSFSDETGYVMLEAKFAQLKFVLHKFFG